MPGFVVLKDGEISASKKQDFISLTNSLLKEEICKPRGKFDRIRIFPSDLEENSTFRDIVGVIDFVIKYDSKGTLTDQQEWIFNVFKSALFFPPDLKAFTKNLKFDTTELEKIKDPAEMLAKVFEIYKGSNSPFRRSSLRNTVRQFFGVELHASLWRKPCVSRPRYLTEVTKGKFYLSKLGQLRTNLSSSATGPGQASRGGSKAVFGRLGIFPAAQGPMKSGQGDKTMTEMSDMGCKLERKNDSPSNI